MFDSKDLEESDEEATVRFLDLVRLSGLGERTLRSLIAAGVVEKPRGRTRAALFTNHAVKQASDAAFFLNQGLRIPQVRRMLEQSGAISAPPPASAGTTVTIAAGIEISISTEAMSTLAVGLDHFIKGVRDSYLESLTPRPAPVQPNRADTLRAKIKDNRVLEDLALLREQLILDARLTHLTFGMPNAVAPQDPCIMVTGFAPEVDLQLKMSLSGSRRVKFNLIPPDGSKKSQDAFLKLFEDLGIKVNRGNRYGYYSPAPVKGESFLFGDAPDKVAAGILDVIQRVRRRP